MISIEKVEKIEKIEKDKKKYTRKKKDKNLSREVLNNDNKTEIPNEIINEIPNEIPNEIINEIPNEIINEIDNENKYNISLLKESFVQEMENIDKSKETNEIQENVQVDNIQGIVQQTDVQGTIEVDNIEQTVEQTDVQENVQVDDIQENEIQENVQVDNIQGIVEVDDIEGIVQQTDVQENIEVDNIEGIVQHTDVQENVEVDDIPENEISEPTHEPIHEPTYEPTYEPTHEPIHEPTYEPTYEPTHEPIHEPTQETIQELELKVVEDLKIDKIESQIEERKKRMVQFKFNDNKHSFEYKLSDLKKVFYTLKEAALLVEIWDGKIKYIEKKGYETRNQSVIDLLIKTNKYKPLPNIQTIFFTNDFIQDIHSYKCPYLFTFTKNNQYKTEHFPNFNFNHWNEARIGEYEKVYESFVNNQITWNEKKDVFFWAGANTNIIREKLFLQTKNKNHFLIHLIDKRLNPTNKYYAIEDNMEYKYLINMNGHSYGGRLNYLFLTGSCVIILKNKDKHKVWDEYFYKYFKPNVHYIEIEYSESDLDNIHQKIEESILHIDPEKIANNAFIQAQKIFKMNEIYDVIYDKINIMSQHWKQEETHIEKSIFYTSESPIYLPSRIYPNPENIYSFHFQGSKFDIIFKGSSLFLFDFSDNIISIYQNQSMIHQSSYKKIMNSASTNQYTIEFREKEIYLKINNIPFLHVPIEVPFVMKDNDEILIRTLNSHGWWII